jgi:uncharacterized protein (TIGR00369 family)
MKLLAKLRAAPGPIDLDNFLGAIPYAQFLGMKVERKGLEITTILPFSDHLIGNPLLPALHGGTLSSFLEMTAIIQLISHSDTLALPKPIDINIDYLRSGRAVETYARAMVTKHGRKVTNVQAEAWQDDRDHPIARLHGHFMLDPRKREES